MTKMKKLFAVVLALAMLFTMAGFSASADAANPAVTVSVEPQEVMVGDTVEVEIALTDLGGVDGTLTYDKDCFEYQSITFENAAVNNEQNSLDKKDGSIHLILVGGGATLTFKATEDAESAEFAFNVTAASNNDGTIKYDADGVNCTRDTVKVTTYGIRMLGAKIRSTNAIDNQDLGFIGQLKTSGDAELVEFGMIAAFTKSLTDAEVADADFTLEIIDQLNAGNETVVAHKAIKDKAVIQSVVASDGLFISHIIGTDTLELMGKNITARFYAIFEVDGVKKTVYSKNTYKNHKDVETATNGISKRSIVTVLGSLITDIYSNVSGDDADTIKNAAKAAVLAYQNRDKTNEESVNAAKQGLLDFVSNNKEHLPESELIG